MADLGNISKIQLVNGDVAHFQDLVSGYTKNTGTITGIKMNGASKGTSGVVDLGTVITAHQDISGKIDTAGTGLSKSGTTLSVKLGYTTSGNNRAVQADSSGNLYVTQKDNNTTYSAGTGLSLSGTTFSAKLGYTTSGNNRAVQADSNGNLYVVQKDDNTNNAVTQTATTTSANYEVLFSVTADNTTRTEGARKNSNLLFNPSTGNLQATQLNGVTIGSSPKFSDTVTTVSTTGSGNAVTAISASNGALTVTKGSTFLTSHQTVTNKGATLAWGSAVTVATIGSTNINVSLPANPNTWRGIQNNLTSTSTTDSLSANQGKILNDTKSRVIKYTSGSFSSLPQTFTVSNCTTAMECVNAVLSVPSAQGSDWTVNTDTAGEVTLSGTFSGSTATTITLYLAEIK